MDEPGGGEQVENGHNTTPSPPSSSAPPPSSSVAPLAKAKSTVPFSRASEFQIKKKLKISNVNAQPFTHARLVACMDPRASCTWLVVNMELCASLSSFYKWNMDPTTIKLVS